MVDRPAHLFARHGAKYSQGATCPEAVAPKEYKEAYTNEQFIGWYINIAHTPQLSTVGTTGP